MNREERRKYGKQTKKSKTQAPINVLNSDYQVASSTGVKLTQLKAYLSAREDEIRKAAILESQEKLWKAEDYIAVLNAMISVYAVKMSRNKGEHTKDLIMKKAWKIRKSANVSMSDALKIAWELEEFEDHTKDLINRMINNFNAAKEYVEKTGIEKAYEYAKQDFGISLEFDSMDINKEFGFDDYDFREEGFEGKSGVEIWNKAWDDADDLAKIINTCTIGITLKRRFGFTNDDIDKLIKESNVRADAAKKGSEGITRLIEEFEKETGMSIGNRRKELVRRYEL